MTSYSLYVFAIIVGCAVATLVAYSFHYIATNGFSDEDSQLEMSVEQRQYMRDVRYRNVLNLQEACRPKGQPWGAMK
ncbi:hypothetical protein N7490_003758 [Penicillium lividum]|nr:hypothetical protein N7490_003758 [Penicillium lividum]